MSPILPILLTTLFTLNFSGSPEIKPSKHSLTQISSFHAEVEDEEIIPWLDSRRLGWEDFRGEPRKNSDAVASTSTSLGISYEVKGGKLNYHISCNFSKIRSWGLLKTGYILAHEQGHFDITEIYARKLHNAMEEYSFDKKRFRKDINDIYQSIIKEKEETQAAYDGETDHSRRRKMQYEWLEKIDILLKETELRANYP